MDFSAAILQARKQGDDVFKVLKEKKITIWEYYIMQNCSLEMGERNWDILTWTKAEGVYTRPTLQEMLKEVLKVGTKDAG